MGETKKVLLSLPVIMVNRLDDLAFDLRIKYRSDLIQQILGLFVPTFNYVQFTQFLYQYFPDRIDDLVAEIAKQEEEHRESR